MSMAMEPSIGQPLKVCVCVCVFVCVCVCVCIVFNYNVSFLLVPLLTIFYSVGFPEAVFILLNAGLNPKQKDAFGQVSGGCLKELSSI